MTIGWLCFRMRSEAFVWGLVLRGALGVFYGVGSAVAYIVTKLAVISAKPSATLISYLLNLTSVAHSQLLLY